MIFKGKDFCEGCKTLKIKCSCTPGDILFRNADGECPCTHCIVKMVCKVTCNDYKRFMRRG